MLLQEYDDSLCDLLCKTCTQLIPIYYRAKQKSVGIPKSGEMERHFLRECHCIILLRETTNFVTIKKYFVIFITERYNKSMPTDFFQFSLEFMRPISQHKTYSNPRF